MAHNARKIDLDAAAHARQEAIGTAVEITWKGTQYRLPIEQPLEVGRHFYKLAGYSDADLSDLPDGATVDAKGIPVLTMEALDLIQNDGLSVLFCDEDELPYPDDDHPGRIECHEPTCQWVRFMRSGITREARNDLIAALTVAYGSDQGEAVAPRGSRKSGGAPSRRTGAGTTGKTSATSTGGTARKPARRTSGNPAKRAAAAPRQS